MNIELFHNPFLIKTKVLVDGKEHSTLKEKFAGRLQMWVEEVFEDIYNILNCPDKLNVTFKGVQADYEDLLHAKEQAENEHGIYISLTHKPVKEAQERSELLQEVIKEANKIKIKGVDNSKLEAAYKNSIDSDFHLQVIATMSSGKSTVINSLLGTELLPAANEATTARIARIYDEAELTDKSFEGLSNSEDGEIYARQKISNETLKEWNNNAEIKEIRIFGNIPSIPQTVHTRLVLTDTPGPNNSQDPDHNLVTARALKDDKMPMMVYVLNATQLGINDDKNLLKQVREARSQGGKQSSDRFIFLVNKIDGYDPEKGESVQRALDNVKEYLEDNGLYNPFLMPVSAQLALLSRKKLNNEELTRAERGALLNLVALFNEEPAMHLLQYMKVSPSIRKKIENQLKEISTSNNSEEVKSLKEAIIHSGIPVLEAMISEYLNKYSLPHRINTAHENIGKYLDELKDIQDLQLEALNLGEQDKQKAEEIIDITNNKILSGKAAEEFRQKIEDQPIKVGKDLNQDFIAFNEKSKSDIYNIFRELSGETTSKNLTVRKIDEAKNAYSYLRNEVIALIENKGNSAQNDELSFLKQQLERHLISLFEEDTESILNLPVSKILLPTLEINIDSPSLEEASYSRTIKVGEEKEWFGEGSKWYNPLSWRQTKNIYETEAGFNLDIIREQLESECLKDIRKLLNKALKHLERNIKDTRIDFVQKVKYLLEKIVSEQLTELQNASKNKEVAELKINEANIVLKYISETESRLIPVFEL